MKKTSTYLLYYWEAQEAEKFPCLNICLLKGYSHLATDCL